MAQIEYIKYLYENEEKSLNEIAKETGFNYRTVRKYAYMENWSADKLPNVEAQSYPTLGKYIPVIDKWLEEDKKIPRKQRHTIKRIYDRLREEEGFKGSYSSVKKYVRKKKYVMRTVNNGYLPLAHPAGEAQADFGEFMYYDGSGRERKGWALTVSFPYSNKGYTQAFPSQNQECFLEGLKRIFERIGGAPVRLRFDNLSSAVAQVLEGKERILTDGFRRFMLHYRFQAEFCNPARGNEKGSVENKVGYSRRNAFVPVPRITSFEDFNEYLWDWCEKDAQREHYARKVSIEELFKEDTDKLLTLPEYPFNVFRYASLSVKKDGFVVIDTNKYGLSPMLGGETVQAKIYSGHIEFYHERRLVGSFRRGYGHNEEIYDWTQYIRTLIRKPSAIEHTRFWNCIPELWRTHISQIQGKERRDALTLLNEIVSDGNACFCEEALELARENGRTDTDSLRQFYYLIAKKEFRPEPMKLSAPALNYKPDLTAYDSLTGGDTHV